ncbi:nucleotidyltransferase domain-containing protein [Candidatus Woesearchaeota archaeon]|nr:nucleotidyltransferase domain-containing protein [Candidatus Woesearchaeota archaeon]
MVLGNLIGSGMMTDLRELKQAYPKVLSWFFSYPTKEIGLTDLSEVLEIAKTTAHQIVNKLVEEEFLKKEVIGKVWRISCNQDHHYNHSKKIAYNLLHIYESKIVDKIKKSILNSRSIVLFGSYSKGDDTEESDLDIAVEILGNGDLEIENVGVIKKLGYREKVPVNVHIFSRNKIDSNLFANIANGVILDGFLEVRP